MAEIPPLPVSPPLAGAPRTPVRSRRCSRHTEREAAGICRECAASFCRECVSEHDGRLLCARCLAKLVAQIQTVPVKATGAWRRRSMTLLSGLVLWLVFLLAGQVMLKIPPDFHEGKFWEKQGQAPRVGASDGAK